jgi:hypothetical protein
LHWYQVLVATADQEVDTWIQNTTSAMTMSLDNTNAKGRDNGIGITSEPLGRIATPFCWSDMPSELPLPFPLPEDFPRMEEDVPIADVPSIYLQRRCPVCFSGTPNLQTSTCVQDSGPYTSISTEISISAHAIVCVDANFAQRRRHS